MFTSQKLQKEDAKGIDIRLGSGLAAGPAGLRGFVACRIEIFIRRRVCKNCKAIVCDTGLKLSSKENI